MCLNFQKGFFATNLKLFILFLPNTMFFKTYTSLLLNVTQYSIIIIINILLAKLLFARYCSAVFT